MKDLLLKIRKLREDLEKHNNSSSGLFSELESKILNSQSEGEIKELLSNTKSIGSISQYGNFTDYQDKLLEELLVELSKELEKITLS